MNMNTLDKSDALKPLIVHSRACGRCVEDRDGEELHPRSLTTSIRALPISKGRDHCSRMWSSRSCPLFCCSDCALQANYGASLVQCERWSMIMRSMFWTRYVQDERGESWRRAGPHARGDPARFPPAASQLSFPFITSNSTANARRTVTNKQLPCSCRISHPI